MSPLVRWEPAIDTQIVIEPRFRGPTNSGNGGYSCGLLAAHFPASVEVTLRAPPPLATPLRIVADHQEARLLHGAEEIASARPADLALTLLPAPSLNVARAATRNYISVHEHVFPECFVCGPGRQQNDGLRIFAGAHQSGLFAAAPWTPDASLDAGDGTVRAEFIWAALDCPAYFGLMTPGLIAVLGRMTATISAPLPVGEPCVAVGWPIFAEGRKRNAGSAIYSADGILIASAMTTWITVDPDRFR